MTPNTPALPSASTLEVVGYLRATKDGKPVWSEDCVCEDPVYPSDPDGSDADTVSMAVCRLSDAQAEIQALRAQYEARELEAHQLSEQIIKLRADARRLDFILKNDAFKHATRTDSGGVAYQLMAQDEDENYTILSGADKFFPNPRAAIDAAVSASGEVGQ